MAQPSWTHLLLILEFHYVVFFLVPPVVVGRIYSLTLPRYQLPQIMGLNRYNALTNWLTDARTLASPDIVIVLVGNKKDLEPDREVTFLEASKFAQDHGG